MAEAYQAVLETYPFRKPKGNLKNHKSYGNKAELERIFK
jgi:hypothetical protein